MLEKHLSNKEAAAVFSSSFFWKLLFLPQFAEFQKPAINPSPTGQLVAETLEYRCGDGRVSIGVGRNWENACCFKYWAGGRLHPPAKSCFLTVSDLVVPLKNQWPIRSTVSPVVPQSAARDPARGRIGMKNPGIRPISPGVLAG
jgi:hypothetical protein